MGVYGALYPEEPYRGSVRLNSPKIPLKGPVGEHRSGRFRVDLNSFNSHN
jgi:hypothetical protein